MKWFITRMLENKNKKQDTFGIYFFYALLIGTAATLWGYQYGSGNQIEQLPIVMRALDAGFLTNDFFTNASTTFGPRFYFAQLLAFLGRWISLPVIYLFLSILSNVLIGLISAFFSRELFDGDTFTGLFTAGAVMSLKTFWLGASNTIYQTYLDPSHLIMPLLLAAIWAGIRKKPVICTLFAGAASIIHPLVGLETGALMMGVILCSMTHTFIKNNGYLPRRQIIRFITGVVILSIFAIPSLLPYINIEHINSTQFIEIVAHLRHPHHYLPSTFGILQYIQAFTFFIALGIAVYLSQPSSKNIYQILPQLIIICVLLFLLCCGGFVFVEVFPTRLWTTAQTFRLLYIVKWLGLVIIAGYLSHQYILDNKKHKVEYFMRTISLISPPTMMISHLYSFLMVKWQKARLHLYNLQSWLSLLFIVLTTIVLYSPEPRVYFSFPIFTIMALSLTYLKRLAALCINIACFAIFLITIFSGNIHLPEMMTLENIKPQISICDLQDDSTDIARFAGAHTPEDALFLVPPKMGEFRFTADRAIVVDFKAFPFQDQAMLEWQNRLYDCYGAPSTEGWAAERDMAIEYRHISDDRLFDLHKKYDFSYAVLYGDTNSSLPVIFQGIYYKIVELD